MTPRELQDEFDHDPTQTIIAIDPITGAYTDDYVEWLEKRLIETINNQKP
jgi:hypothetical protein